MNLKFNYEKPGAEQITLMSLASGQDEERSLFPESECGDGVSDVEEGSL